ncbi:hypothetical protein Hdeb2414_s0164g00819491 [Helianthus debilis subsp. tardiflorus]
MCRFIANLMNNPEIASSFINLSFGLVPLNEERWLFWLSAAVRVINGAAVEG